MNLKKKLRALWTILASASLVVSGASVPAANAANETQLVVGTLQNLNSWDPSQADHAHRIIYYQAVYDNLITRLPNGQYKGNLATSWEINSKFTEITLKLRSGVKFTDGEVFDADAAKANLDNFINGKGPWARIFTGAKATVVDTNTVKLTLAKPEPEILYFLSVTNSFMASPKALGTAGLKTVPVGSGPYMYDKSSKPGIEYVLVANPNYWDKSKQKFKKVVIKVLDVVTARLNAIMSGQINATLLDVKTTATAQKNKKLTFYKYENDFYGLMLWDRDGKVNEAIGKKEVRQAINYALDRKALLKTIQGGLGTVTAQPFGKTSGAYVAALDNAYPYNPAKAKELLAKAGYPNGFTLEIPSWGNQNPAENAAVEKYLKDVGITVKWDNVSLNDAFGKILTGKYAASTFGLTQGSAWFFLNLGVAPDATRNVLKTKNPVVDAAIAKIEASPSANLIKSEITKVNKEIVEQAWFAPFYRNYQLYFTSTRIKVTPQLGSAVPFLYNFEPTGK